MKRSIRDLVRAERKATAKAAHEQLIGPIFLGAYVAPYIEVTHETAEPDPVALAAFELKIQTWRLK